MFSILSGSRSNLYSSLAQTAVVLPLVDFLFLYSLLEPLQFFIVNSKQLTMYINAQFIGCPYWICQFLFRNFNLSCTNFIGCRSASINIEARSLGTWSSSRHCVIAKIQDLSIEQFRDVSEKAGALIVVLPSDLSALNIEDREVIKLSIKVSMRLFMRLFNLSRTCWSWRT